MEDTGLEQKREEVASRACESCAPVVVGSLPEASQHVDTQHHHQDPTIFALQSRAHLQPSRAEANYLGSQYLCGASAPDSQHITLRIEASNPETRNVTRTVRALVDCGATSNFISPKLSERLRLASTKANTATYGVDGKTLCEAEASRQCDVIVAYEGDLNHISPHQITALVVEMEAYDVILGMPWFAAEDPEIDWRNRRLLGLGRHRRVANSASNSPTTAGISMMSTRSMHELLYQQEAVEMAYLVKIEHLTAGRLFSFRKTWKASHLRPARSMCVERLPCSFHEAAPAQRKAPQTNRIRSVVYHALTK